MQLPAADAPLLPQVQVRCPFCASSASVCAGLANAAVSRTESAATDTVPTLRLLAQSGRQETYVATLQQLRQANLLTVRHGMGRNPALEELASGRANKDVVKLAVLVVE